MRDPRNARLHFEILQAGQEMNKIYTVTVQKRYSAIKKNK